MSLVSSGVSECADEIGERAHRLVEMDHLLGYLTWLQHIMELKYEQREKKECL